MSSELDDAIKHASLIWKLLETKPREVSDNSEAKLALGRQYIVNGINIFEGCYSLEDVQDMVKEYEINKTPTKNN